jgi:hypothetical protein
LFKPNLRNILIQISACSCIIELYKKWYSTLSRIFFLKAGFSLYITGRISEAAMGWVGGAQRPVLGVQEPKKTGGGAQRPVLIVKEPKKTGGRARGTKTHKVFL